MLTTAESLNYKLKFHNLAFKEIYIAGEKRDQLSHTSINWVPVSSA